MSVFGYKAMDASGTIVAGRIDAANPADLEARLARLGLDLIDGNVLRQQPRFGGGMPRRALINFCFHLEQLIRAGVPIIDALADLRDSTSHPQFRAVLDALVESVAGGKRVSEAMADHPRIFDSTVVSLVRAGEDSGQLPEVLSGLVATLKWRDELAAQTRKLALYPAFLAAATLALVFFLMIYLVPKMVGFMRSMDYALPFHTRLLISVSEFVGAYWYLLLGVPAIAAAALRFAVARDPRVRLAWDAATLRLPVAGNVLRKVALARFAATFAMMYGAGIAVLDAMRATEDVVANTAVARSLRQAGHLISAGATIAAAFEQAGLFPPLVIRMLRVGESTGALDRALANVEYFFNRDVREAVERAQAMAEPAITLIIGLVMGWVMLSVLGPIYDVITRVGV